VSERTVFRYFPSHAALREALVPLIADRLGQIEPPTDARDLVAYVAALYRVCEANAGLTRTLVRTVFGRALLEHERARRLGRLQAAIAAAPRRARRLATRRAAATIRYLASGTAWEFYRDQAGLSLEDAIAAATAAIDAVLRGVGITSRREARARPTRTRALPPPSGARPAAPPGPATPIRAASDPPRRVARNGRDEQPRDHSGPVRRLRAR
jgi:AcrR family transcriptional regulator